MKWDREDGHNKEKDKDRDKDRDRDRDRDREKGKDRDINSDMSLTDQMDETSRSHSVLCEGVTGMFRGSHSRAPLGPYSPYNNAQGGPLGSVDTGALALGYASVGDEKDREHRDRDRDRDRERERDRNGDTGKSSVPTRLTVKKASSLALAEAKRKSDLASRRRRYVRTSHPVISYLQTVYVERMVAQ